MEITCEVCGKTIVTADDLVQGQHVLCPYCGGKFSYAGGRLSEITREDLAKSIAQCRRDENDNRYYSSAPAGARLYIGLIFYGKVFGGRINRDIYMAALTAVEPDLKRRDLEYLIAHEDNRDLIAYFNGLLANCGEDAADNAPQTRHELPRVTGGIQDRPHPAVAGFERRHEGMRERKLRTEDELQARAWRRTLVNRLSMTACFLAVVIVGWMLFSAWQDRQTENRRRFAEERALAEERARAADERRQAEAARAAQEAAERHVREEEERERLRIAKAQADEQEAKIRAEQEKESKARREAEEARDRIRARYEEAKAAFCDDELAVVEGALSGKFACALPDGAGAFGLYEVVFDGKGEPTVVKILPDAEPVPVAWLEFKAAVGKSGCLYSNGDKSFYQPRDGALPTECAVPDGNATVCPGALVFGNVLPLIRILGIDGNGMGFALRLEKARGFEQDITTLSIDDEIGREPFAKAVEQVLLEQKVAKITGTGLGIPKPKVTVVMFDGAVGKKDVHGVTYVPRKFPYSEDEPDDSVYFHSSYHWSNAGLGSRCNCARCKRRRKIAKAKEAWERLCDEAERQQVALADYEEKVGNEIEKRKSQVKVLPREVNAVLKRAVIRFVQMQDRSQTVSPGD